MLDFIRQEIGERHAHQWAIHNPGAALAVGEQPHAHLMYSERTVDGIDRDPELGRCRKWGAIWWQRNEIVRLNEDIAQIKRQAAELEKRKARIKLTTCDGRLCAYAASDQGGYNKEWRPLYM